MPDDPLSITFAALADPTRRAILARLATGDATVNELAEPFDISLQAVSKHLKVLERAGLITRGRDAQYRPCRLEAERRSTPPSTGSNDTARSGRTGSTSSSSTSETSNDPEADDQASTMNDTARQPRRSHLHPHVRRPRELVFRCMTTPEHLTHFWGPVGITTPIENITVDPASRRRLRDDHGRRRRPVPSTRAAACSSRSTSPSRLVWTRARRRGRDDDLVTFIDLGDGRTEVLVAPDQRARDVPQPGGPGRHAEQLRSLRRVHRVAVI